MAFQVRIESGVPAKNVLSNLFFAGVGLTVVLVIGVTQVPERKAEAVRSESRGD